jgi:hypothetical protein
VSLPIVLRDEATAEFDEAFDWCDAKQIGLGSEFVAEVQKVFDRIAANPLVHRIVFADIPQRVSSADSHTAFSTGRTPTGWRSSPCSTRVVTRRSGSAGPDAEFARQVRPFFSGERTDQSPIPAEAGCQNWSNHPLQRHWPASIDK